MMKSIVRLLFTTAIILILTGCTREPTEPFGTYSYTSQNQRTSTITVNKDGSIQTEVNTNWGVRNSEGTYAIEGETIKMKWERTSFQNLLGPRPDIEKVESQVIKRDKDGDWLIQIGSTSYYLEKQRR